NRVISSSISLSNIASSSIQYAIVNNCVLLRISYEILSKLSKLIMKTNKPNKVGKQRSLYTELKMLKE
ncbi:MAG: hypothetical protein ACWGNP_04880, partial [Candidatus Bathyarchaeia archaeon]